MSEKTHAEIFQRNRKWAERQVAAPNTEVRRSAPARQQQAVRLPPRRAQAFTAAPHRAHEAPPARPTRPEDDTVIVHHPAMRRSDPAPRKEVRPRALSRGKHKVERVD